MADFSLSDALGDSTPSQAKTQGNTNPSAPANNPPHPSNPGWPTSAPGAPTQPSAPSGYPGGCGPGAPGPFPFPSSPGAPGHYSGPPSAPGGFPSAPGVPGQYPPAPGAPGQYPSGPGAPGQFPGHYPPEGAPGQLPGGPVPYPAGPFPSGPGAPPGPYPNMPLPGNYPPAGNGVYGPGGPGAFPPPAGPGSFPAFPGGGFPPIPPGSWGSAGGGFPPAPGSFGPGLGPAGSYEGPPAPGGMLMVPYDLPLHAGILPRLVITIIGEPLPAANRFHVDFIKGPDVVFHLNPRFIEQTIVRNSNIGGCWGPEERGGIFPFVPGRRFELKILVEEDMFKVAVDGSHLLEYEHRVGGLEDVTLLRVVGDVVLYSASPSMM
ncbi:galectin-3 [Dunckerocampus dactyliophorus]|uniref:galectin-3 n=1 Tax=Dunckerocampus dactyliophorus TaxID=161453 RepID=UPI00240507F7|nr:galectin-3 [Dunckerocampus dactyliophorus]XP_054652920.1 galectin-3 [Dunckerocampus dactyliophorus]